MMLFSLAPERLHFLSTLCRFLTGQKQAMKPTITRRALPDCGEGGSEAAERHKPRAIG
ncbi:MAG: hypothetical protein IAE80_25020 [Anaerolinea sp.]|nr:hypothetical protein [Anaerolinea sp.]